MGRVTDSDSSNDTDKSKSGCVSIQFLNDQKPDTNTTSIVKSFLILWDFAYPDANIVSCACLECMSFKIQLCIYCTYR